MSNVLSLYKKRDDCPACLCHRGNRLASVVIALAVQIVAALRRLQFKSPSIRYTIRIPYAQNMSFST